ncbi:hypothetical protein [Nitrosopumilus sp.]|uniref:hypothetical protein n=1 Tax=Nitrosopumilus sp. TaxID=2024843 RepID=UPI00247D2A8E|nr:hypothetical protein [Nitrosopumilus sp.]MCV0430154.1 hypothetical protein [Nitrosopumilus sp.]
MSFEPNYRATLVILDDFEVNGLIQFNKEYADEGFFNNFIKFRRSFSHSINELISKLDTFETKNSEMMSFIIYSELSFINSHLEAIKKFLKIIINPTKVDEGLEKDTTLQQMIQKICKKLNYNQKLENSIKGLFLLDLKDAIMLEMFLIETDHLIIYPNNLKMKKQLDIKDLATHVSQATEILSAMLDWSNGKTKKQKPDELDGIVRDLSKQVEELDKKLEKLS